MANKALEMRIAELEKIVATLNEKLDGRKEEPKEIKEIKKTTGLKKDGTPRKKRAPCGYMMFSNEKRAEIREKLLEDAEGEKVQPGAVVKRLAEMWNALSEEEKTPYNDMAKASVSEDEE